MLKNALKYVQVIVTAVLVLSLLTASASAWIKPSTTMVPTYLGIAFPFIAAATIALGVFYIFRGKWKLFFLIVAAFVLCGHNMAKTIGWHPSGKEEKNSDVTLLTYNVKLFNFYDKRTKILDYVLKQDADIVCLQEFGYYTGNEKNYLTREKILKKMTSAYPYHHFSQSSIMRNGTYGMATFSKYPIVKHNDIEIESKYNSVIYSDIKIGDDTLRVINMHLESDKLTSPEKKDLQHFGYTDSTSGKALIINRKLKEAYKLREKQADKIAAFIDKSKKAILLCGDSNDVPVSYTYSTLSGSKLTDAFLEEGWGYGHTYNEGVIKFRIDNVKHSSELKATSYRRDTVSYSDHYPLIVGLNWTNK